MADYQRLAGQVMALSPSDYTALIELAWGERNALARPMRRRLHAEGLLVDNEMTPLALEMVTKYAPRSKWEPPKHQGPVLPPHMRMAPSRMSSRMLLPLLAATLGGGR